MTEPYPPLTGDGYNERELSFCRELPGRGARGGNIYLLRVESKGDFTHFHAIAVNEIDRCSFTW